MQKDILFFFLSISNPTLDIIANMASFLGEQAIMILILGWILYCGDKRKGFAVGGAILSSTVSMGIIKSIIRAPRPFMVLSEIQGKRLSTATGYSFPSGHTTGAASIYSSVAIAFKKKKLSLFCALAIVLVGLSRMYLGVHWPIDVFGGLVLGISLSFILYPVFYEIAGDNDKKYLFSLILGIFTSVIAIIMTVLLQNQIIDSVAYTDLVKTLALAGGAYMGFALEVKKINYSTEGTNKIKIIRLILLVACSLLILGGVKLIVPESLYFIGALVRYLLLGLFLTFLFPLIFKKLFN